MPRSFVSVPLKLVVKERETGKTVKQSTVRTKTKLLSNYTLAKKEYTDCDHVFECEVMYNKKLDVWNRFEFKSTTELTDILKMNLEIEFLQELLKCGFLEKRFLRK